MILYTPLKLLRLSTNLVTICIFDASNSIIIAMMVIWFQIDYINNVWALYNNHRLLWNHGSAVCLHSYYGDQTCCNHFLYKLMILSLFSTNLFTFDMVFGYFLG